MLTFLQQVKLFWFKTLYKYQSNPFTINNLFKYTEEQELFYEIHKYIQTKIQDKYTYNYYVIYAFSKEYNKYPKLHSIIKRLIGEFLYIKQIRLSIIRDVIETADTRRCADICKLCIDKVRLNKFLINTLIGDFYTEDTKINGKSIYEYLYELGGNYEDIPITVHREKIRHQIQMDRICLLVRILKNVPSELVDVRKLTHYIGQFILLKGF